MDRARAALLLLAALLGGLASFTPPSPASWGTRGCSPRGPVGPTLRLPAIAAAQAQPAPLALGPAGCSQLCTCGCNQGQPCRCRPQPERKPEAPPIFGLESERLSKDPGPVLWLNGRRTITGDGLGDGLPDLSTRRYLTVISADAGRRQQILDELRASPQRDQYRMQGCAPGTWQTETHKLDQDDRFRRSGLVVLVQEPAGTVTYAQYDWQGAEAFLRRADPAYDPNKNPTGPPSFVPWFDQVPPWAPVAGIVLLAAAAFLFARPPEAPHE